MKVIYFFIFFGNISIFPGLKGLNHRENGGTLHIVIPLMVTISRGSTIFPMIEGFDFSHLSNFTGSDRASFLEQVSRDLALRDSSDAAVSRARIHEKHQKKRRKERSKRGGVGLAVGGVIFGCWDFGGLLHTPNIFVNLQSQVSEMPVVDLGVSFFCCF